MEEIHPPLTTNQTSQEYGYGLAYKLAQEQLAKIDDIDQLCFRTGARSRTIDSQKAIILEYLNESYQILLPDIKLSPAGSEQEVPLRDRILILHYLTQAKGTPLTRKLIAYKELPEGVNYFPTFYLRAIKPLVKHFGNQPQRLLDVSRKLGGTEAEYGDISVTINAFSRVPITLILWQGDDELPPEGNILFDSTISDYLPTEDINVLCEIIAWKLVKLLKETSHPQTKSG
jgi:hypothetical protein